MCHRITLSKVHVDGSVRLCNNSAELYGRAEDQDICFNPLEVLPYLSINSVDAIYDRQT